MHCCCRAIVHGFFLLLFRFSFCLQPLLARCCWHRKNDKNGTTIHFQAGDWVRAFCIPCATLRARGADTMSTAFMCYLRDRRREVMHMRVRYGGTRHISLCKWQSYAENDTKLMECAAIFFRSSMSINIMHFCNFFPRFPVFNYTFCMATICMACDTYFRHVNLADDIIYCWFYRIKWNWNIKSDLIHVITHNCETLPFHIGQRRYTQ